MIKTHELDVTASKFSELLESNYKIIKQNDYEQNDYILFREIETVEEEVSYTSKSQLTQIKSLIIDEGIKEGYVLAVLNKI
ncbi:MAG: hypothetical protein PHV15_05795 [Thomasclavelia ramosa]|uniref:hypothetical protein n=1 Tax=Thomasclavelia ramosa TaxID=1547 RepID=UPI001D07689D|nr:hypothetical protein [Thomasclavelia ramosa]MCB6435538.1 hypothetical protein [Thomasclavelia ramosa]MCB6458587.1 hypothetical protein [Thomasclavelia ramosa]MCB6598734.1 hypothetical protein [Thomasclavelia ramosa]MCB6600307.1 hypothetical protein [Thomasclavelia ramosa]MCB6620023.1 hypothetical protein [Thomasclavelia ramosa]